MVDFQQKKKIRKVIYSRVTIFVLFVAVIFLTRSVYDIFTKERISAENLAMTQKDYSALEARQTTLKSDISRLNTQGGVEEEIRSKFSVAKPGETVVMIVDSTSSSSTDSQGNKKSFWQRFVDFFKTGSIFNEN